MARTKHWLLVVVCWDQQHGYHWHNWTETGPTAVDAFLKLTAFHDKAASKETHDGVRRTYRSYAAADLINAWEITAKQAERFQ